MRGAWQARLERLLQRAWFDAPSARPRIVLALVPLLGLLSLIVGWTARRRLIKRRSLPAPPVPLVIVGNLVVGGSGKTPICIALLQHWQGLGKPALALARGHGAPGSGASMLRPGKQDARAAALFGDEPLLLERSTHAPVAVGKQRANALCLGLSQYPEATRVLSDDGLQHATLPRSLELCVWDERGAGNAHCLPLGPLREPAGHAFAVDAWLVRSTQSDTTLPWPSDAARQQVQRLAASLRGDPPAWFEVRMRYGPLSPMRPADRWEDMRQALVVTGIANPQRLWQSLHSAAVLSGKPAMLHALRDHAPVAEFEAWLGRVNPSADTALIITAKDAVKLPESMVQAHSWWIWELQATIDPAGLEWIEQRLVEASR